MNHSSPQRTARMSGRFSVGLAGMNDTSSQPFLAQRSATNISKRTESGCPFDAPRIFAACASIPPILSSWSRSRTQSLKYWQNSRRLMYFSSIWLVLRSFDQVKIPADPIFGSDKSVEPIGFGHGRPCCEKAFEVLFDRCLPLIPLAGRKKAEEPFERPFDGGIRGEVCFGIHDASTPTRLLAAWRFRKYKNDRTLARTVGLQSMRRDPAPNSRTPREARN